MANFFNNQIEYATTVVLSRSQRSYTEQLEFCVKQIQKLNPKAAIITTPWDEIQGSQILKVIEGQDNLEMKTLAEAAHEAHEHEHHHDHDHEHHHDHDHEHHHDHDHEHDHHHEHGEGCTCGCHDHDHEHHHADDVFTSWGKETPHIFERATIEHALKAFAETEDYGTVIRSKGMVQSTDGTWIYFDLVDGEYELRTGEPDYTGRLVVIGTGIDEHQLENSLALHNARQEISCYFKTRIRERG